MKKRLLKIAAITAAVAAAAGIFFTSVRTAVQGTEVSAQASAKSGPFSALASAETGDDGGDRYVVRAYNGEICVFYADRPDVPAVYTGIALSSLRDSDRELVEKGIKLDTYEELVGILEDFGS